MKHVQIILIAIAVSIITALLTAYVTVQVVKPSQDDLITEFYRVENAVHISPHSLRGKMDKGEDDFILVDLRSVEEYEKEHIIGAINIPAYKDRFTSAYDEKERILSAFEALPDDREIIVYCYSTPCMTGRKIGLMLAEEGVYVKHLGIGWNDWRYDWQAWNHEHEWNTTSPEMYLWSGPEPGKLNVTRPPPGCTENGEYGC